MDVSVIGEKIKKRRNELNLTQKQLALKLNISNQLVSKWETGESVPSLEFLDALCRALEVDFSYFTDGGKATETQDGKGGAQTCETVAPSGNIPPPATSRKRRFNLKLFLIIFCSVAGALLVAAITLLSVFVFVPAADRRYYEKNRENYLNDIERSFGDYFALGFYSIHYRTEVDGDEREDYVCNGYFEENGSVALYNGRTGRTVKDGFLTYDYDTRYKYTYVQDAEYASLEELALSQVFDDYAEEESDPLEDIVYMRKVGGGYYIEMCDEYFTDELTGTQKKNFKLLDKIKGSVKIENGLFRSMSITVKYRNQPDNENFTLYTLIEFNAERPVIAHTDLDGRELYTAPSHEYPDDNPNADMPVCGNKVDTAEAISLFTDGAAKKAAVDDGETDMVYALLDGRFYVWTRDGIMIVNPENPAQRLTVNMNAENLDNFRLYGGKLYYSGYNTANKYVLTVYAKDIFTGVEEALFSYRGTGIGIDRIYYFGAYACYHDYTASSVYPHTVIYGLAGKKEIYRGNNLSVGYVDGAGYIYGSDLTDAAVPAVWSGNKPTVLKGNDFYRISGEIRTFGDSVYTVDSRNAYEYVHGVYKATYSLADARFRKGYREMDGGYCFADESVFDKNVYNSDGGVRGEISTVVLKEGEKETRATFYRILEAAGDKLLVQLSGEGKYYYAVYDAGDLSKPICFTDAPPRYAGGASFPEFVVKNVDGKIILGVRNSADFADAYDIWVI